MQYVIYGILNQDKISTNDVRQNLLWRKFMGNIPHSMYIVYYVCEYKICCVYTYVYPYPPIEINQRENVVKIKANSLKHFVYITMYTLASGSV